MSAYANHRKTVAETANIIIFKPKGYDLPACFIYIPFPAAKFDRRKSFAEYASEAFVVFIFKRYDGFTEFIYIAYFAIFLNSRECFFITENRFVLKWNRDFPSSIDKSPFTPFLQRIYHLRRHSHNHR